MSRTQPESVRGIGFVLDRRAKMFILSVFWSDGSESLIYRTFQEFRKFHKRLKDTFPLEAGLLKSSDCILPKFQDGSVLLPSRRTRRGLVRLRMLEDYSQKLLGATEVISQSEVVIAFFQSQPGDLVPDLPQNSLVIMPSTWERSQQSPKKPLASQSDIHILETQTFRCLDSFNTQDTKGKPFKAEVGEELDVLLREPTGWWLVENQDKQIAWFPAPYLEEVSPRRCEELPQMPRSGLLFWTSGAYESSREDELSVPAGARVTLLQASERGWWRCRYRGRQGLLPAVLLYRPPDPASGLDALLTAGRTLREPEASGGAQAEPPHPPPAARRSSDCNSEGEAPAPPGPAVPARPPRGDILRRCCSVTRRALLGSEAPKSPGPGGAPEPGCRPPGPLPPRPRP
ncbi:NADPH oxidase organizer 1 [Macrotis lagotis]|uniref:NADPH oxidase organizer 1 n=1 Tax=Macrotis lagotis TaxID=92651 RepID=UPI003D68D687